MKKILLSIISILLSFSVINISNASNNIDHKLYKKVTITNIQIKKDYWEKVYKKIVSIFAQIRYDKDTTKLNKLKTLLVKKIKEIQNKNYLSKTDEKKLNLYNNLLYRTTLLLEFNLK